ncbi:MAG: ATP-binding protein, partial [Candidatus Hadarchaeales archaeon]
GIGMAKKDIPKLFKKFSQLDSSGSRKYGGTGLGLAISKEIIKAHKGKIWASSPGPGKGSTFTFILPIKPK